ncbi:MAG: SGNH/GDSL hydrolase family protein [Acidimicrobiia bacterium]|nr:SGNH/GDSL hydrolase family protein [Acidimicrobiia bacterium]
MRGLVALLAVALLAGCSSDDDGPDVLVVGDSITDMSREAIIGAVADDQIELRIEAVPGATSTQMRERVTPLAGEVGEQVVINLGTNDIIGGRDPAETAVEIAALVDQHPGVRCVHVTTVNPGVVTFVDADVDQQVIAFNLGMFDLERQRLHVNVIDWAGALADPPDGGVATDYLEDDGIHPNEAGTQLLARLYAEALASCKGAP